MSVSVVRVKRSNDVYQLSVARTFEYAKIVVIIQVGFCTQLYCNKWMWYHTCLTSMDSGWCTGDDEDDGFSSGGASASSAGITMPNGGSGAWNSHSRQLQYDCKLHCSGIEDWKGRTVFTKLVVCVRVRAKKKFGNHWSAFPVYFAAATASAI